MGDDDVQIDILFCGVCHPDLHYAPSEWMPATYPLVVGHEIVGKVVQVGLTNASPRRILGSS
ncbi:MAG: alcohol dehydrogenase catalytic domain-containing protein [Chthoniobacterales bacterium]